MVFLGEGSTVAMALSLCNGLSEQAPVVACGLRLVAHWQLKLGSHGVLLIRRRGLSTVDTGWHLRRGVKPLGEHSGFTGRPA